MNNRRRSLLCTPILLFAIFPLYPEDSGIKTSTGLTLQASSLPEGKLGITRNFSFPLLRGEGPITKDNNLNLALTAEVSPVSLNGIAEAVLTPIAFLQAVAGARIGSGWNINLFGSNAYGIGINHRISDDDHRREVSGGLFDGIIWNAWAGAVFQFDLAALFPGDWNHVVFRTYHAGRYNGYTAASAADSWFFENDDGQNRNGFYYYGNFLLGYQMPGDFLFLNTIGFMAEVEKYLRVFPGGDAWGDELPRWTFGPLINFTITKKFSAALVAQFRTRRHYTVGREDDALTKEIFYQDRILKTDAPRYLTFFRAAVVLSYTLR
jgi:hypothetical protein